MIKIIISNAEKNYSIIVFGKLAEWEERTFTIKSQVSTSLHTICRNKFLKHLQVKCLKHLKPETSSIDYLIDFMMRGNHRRKG